MRFHCRISNAVSLDSSFVTRSPQCFDKWLREDAFIFNAMTRAHIYKSQVGWKSSANACGRTEIDNTRIGWGQFQKSHNRSASQIGCFTCQSNGMRIDIVFSWNVVLGKIHAVTFLDECSSLGHCRKLVLVNSHGNGLGGCYDPIMIFREIPQCFISSHVNSITKRLTFDKWRSCFNHSITNFGYRLALLCQKCNTSVIVLARSVAAVKVHLSCGV